MLILKQQGLIQSSQNSYNLIQKITILNKSAENSTKLLHLIKYTIQNNFFIKKTNITPCKHNQLTKKRKKNLHS